MIRNILTGVALGALVAANPAHAIGPEITKQQQPVQQANVTQPVLQAEAAADEPQRSGGLLGGIFGCSADGSNQTVGAAIGGVAGAFLGNRIAGSGSRTLGTILGGAVGAAAGSAVGCKLQKNDRDRAERAAQDALETGKTQNWANAETGASGRIEVADPAATGSSLGDLRLAPGVEPVLSYVKVGDSYTTSVNTNLRGGPGTNTPVRATLPAGQRVWVPAQVKGQPWMLISDNGIGQGYVSAGLLKKTTAVAAANCKLVTQSVTVPGEAEQSETYQACKGTDGQWAMTRV